MKKIREKVPACNIVIAHVLIKPRLANVVGVGILYSHPIRGLTKKLKNLLLISELRISGCILKTELLNISFYVLWSLSVTYIR